MLKVKNSRIIIASLLILLVATRGIDTLFIKLFRMAAIFGLIAYALGYILKVKKVN